MEVGHHTNCSNHGCKNTFCIPREGKLINHKWWCDSCARIIERGMKGGVTVAKQLVSAVARMDG